MNGILVVDKPIGYTSRDVVNIVGKCLKTKKVGHTGTLDNLASGVLVLCVGNCLKLGEILTCEDKVYEAKVILGIETDTLDLEGKVIAENKDILNITEDRVREVLLSFVGNIMQEVPKYSAVSVNGKRLYQYAREGIEVRLPKREVMIKAIELISDVRLNKDGRYEFEIRCHVSKGTYIRSLVRDIGYALGSYATMGALRRIKQGDFELGQAYTLEDIFNNNFQLLNPVDIIKMEKVVVDKDMKFKISNGQVLDKFFDDEVAMVLDDENNLLAIYKDYENNMVKPWKMFLK